MPYILKQSLIGCRHKNLLLFEKKYVVIYNFEKVDKLDRFVAQNKKVFYLVPFLTLFTAFDS